MLPRSDHVPKRLSAMIVGQRCAAQYGQYSAPRYKISGTVVPDAVLFGQRRLALHRDRRVHLHDLGRHTDRVEDRHRHTRQLGERRRVDASENVALPLVSAVSHSRP